MLDRLLCIKPGINQTCIDQHIARIKRIVKTLIDGKYHGCKINIGCCALERLVLRKTAKIGFRFAYYLGFTNC
jgi:hypothetical protein